MCEVAFNFNFFKTHSFYSWQEETLIDVNTFILFYFVAPAIISEQKISVTSNMLNILIPLHQMVIPSGTETLLFWPLIGLQDQVKVHKTLKMIILRGMCTFASL